jgi:hypothetical protein
MRRVSPSQSLAQVAIAVVMYKVKRGGVCVGGAQCAVACREAFFLVVGWLSRKRVGLQSCRPSRNKRRSDLFAAAWGCLHFAKPKRMRARLDYSYLDTMLRGCSCLIVWLFTGICLDITVDNRRSFLSLESPVASSLHSSHFYWVWHDHVTY